MPRPILANGLLLGYPVLVHAAIVTDSALLACGALLLLGCNILGPWLLQARPWAWVLLIAGLPASVLFVTHGEGRLFFYAAPVLVAVALLWLFGRTLVSGRVPLITRIAAAIRGPLPEPVRRYTRQVTQLWVAVFAGMALANLMLALFASPVLWSLFANFINYLLVAGLFGAEWLFRCWYLGGQETLTWREYLQALSRLDYRRLLATRV